jgi:DNA-binding NtrC family response regulator
MKENTILLVDVDGDCEALVSAAAIRTSRKVLMAKTSRDAFRILEDEMQWLDLVIVDVDPSAHGLALLEAISGCADRPQIVVITALEEAYMTPIAIKHGASVCLGKPITLQRLGSVFNHVLKRSLTCNRWGSLVPSTADERINIRASLNGIVAKLGPSSCGGSCSGCRQKNDKPKSSSKR